MFNSFYLGLYLCEPSLQTKIRHQLCGMIIEILAADAVAMSICIISPANDARIRYVSREEVSEPVGAVSSRPGLVAVPVQAMDNNNAGNCQHDLRIR